MANATKYVDNVNGNNGNTGDSEAQAYADLATALAAITGGGNIIYIQAGADYSYAATETFTAGLKGDVTNGRNKLIGYTTTPGAADGRPVITSATDSVHLFTLNDNDYWEFRHLKFTHTAATTKGAAFTSVTSASTPLWFVDCIIDGCLTFFNAMASAGTCYLEDVEVANTTSTTGAFIMGGGSGTAVNCYGCDFHDNAAAAIRCASLNVNINLQDCIFDTNANGILIIGNQTSTITSHGCIYVDHSDSAIDLAATAGTYTLEFQNNAFYGSTGYGIENLDGAAVADAGMRINRNNAFGSNSSGAYTGLSAGSGEVTLTADPFTNRAGRDFSPNTTAGGGALLRAAGFPSAFPSGATRAYTDIGITGNHMSARARSMIGI